jgi:CubicO group peptidase (beta-lactamase class C family)
MISKTIIVCTVFTLMAIGAYSQMDQYQEKLKKFDQELVGRLFVKEPGLSIIITLEDRIIYELYFGYANLSQDVELSKEQVLGIASMSKQFTGMATLILAEEGKINLEDDIKKYLPDLPIGEKKITISQLLSHTSGLPEITKNDVFMANINKKHTIQEIIDMAFEGDFAHEPGEKWQYCNTGYTIMAKVIEKISRQSYANFLHDKIFAPLGMNNSYSCDYNRDADNAVPRYFSDSAGYRSATTMHFSNLISGGGIISNVSDMSKWGIALITGAQLPSNYMKIWETTYLNSGEPTSYGLGLAENSYKEKSYFYHPGMGDGMNSVNFIFPDDGITITVIRNVSNPKLTSVEVAQMATEYLFFDGNE